MWLKNGHALHDVHGEHFTLLDWPHRDRPTRDGISRARRATQDCCGHITLFGAETLCRPTLSAWPFREGRADLASAVTEPEHPAKPPDDDLSVSRI
jgi:hypothetical protein